MWASPHFSSAFITRRFKGVSRLVFTTEEHAGVLDSTSSTPTEQKPAWARDWAAAVGG